MRDAFVRTAAVIVLATATASASAGCASPQDTIQQQQEKLQSLAASAQLLTDDYLAGQVSKTYAATAFDALLLQVEQQRAVVARPKMLADAKAAALSQQAEALSRLLAQMRDDVARGDAAALGARRAGVAPLPGRQ